jgi:hypothetical protein
LFLFIGDVSSVVFLLAQILYNKDIPFSIPFPKEPNSRA